MKHACASEAQFCSDLIWFFVKQTVSLRPLDAIQPSQTNSLLYEIMVLPHFFISRNFVQHVIAHTLPADTFGIGKAR